MIGCFISEKYYTSNIQRRAVIIAYTLTTFSSISLSLFNLLYDNYKNLQVIIAIGYGLSGIGQALLVILMVSYATPYIKLYHKSALLPILVGLLNFSGAVGTSLAYLMTTTDYPNYLNIGFNIILLVTSIIISSNMKVMPRSFSDLSLNKPEISFSYFSTTFYTYGVIYGIYSSVLVRELKEYYFMNFNEKICLFQGIYSLSYCIGASIVYYFIKNEKRNFGWVILSIGIFAAGLGFYNINFLAHTSSDHQGIILINLNNFALGVLDGIVEPLTLHKIVTQSNRPEFFTSLFYFLASITDVMIVSCPR